MKIFVTSAYSYWGNFLPTDLRDPKATTQVGGGETALINVSRELAALGHDVTVFYDTARPGTYEGVVYLPTKLFPELACAIEHDVLVSWDFAQAFRYADRAKKHVLCFQLNDAAVGVFNEVIDLYFHPSLWHAKRFRDMYPEIPENKQLWQMTNGVDTIRYTQDVPRDSKRVIHSSSPDRGLHHLLRVWPAVQARVPEASLHVFYDMNRWLSLVDSLEQQGFITNTYDRAQAVRRAMAELNGAKVTFHGAVGQWQLAREQLQSALMVYPCDPVQPTEGFSMSCLEAITAGCSLITTNADALGELWADAPGTVVLPLPIDDGVLIDAIVNELTEPREPREPKVPEHLMWRSIAAEWEKCLTSQ